MFQGFVEEHIEGDGATLFVRRAARKDAPPVVLIHGYPQTSAMWHQVAPVLAREFQIICPDLRGYGRSDKPQSNPSHEPYSKRAMARDVAAVIQNLASFYRRTGDNAQATKYERRVERIRKKIGA